MPIYSLTEDLVFPHPSLAEDGVLAVGGDLSVERLILAYSNGIFPWYSDGEPIIWHAPNPRFVLHPKDLKVSKSMKQVMRRDKFQLTINQDFRSVITNCKLRSRKGQEGTWITNEMLEAYCNLHELGFAHSVEVYQDNLLVGGLYGINLGTVFFGESMFHSTSNASKLAFIKLVQSFPFSIIDCQVHTQHMEKFGATNMELSSFLSVIVKETQKLNLLNRSSNFVGSNKPRL